MTSHDQQAVLKWIECWQQAGPKLEKIRREEIRKSDTQKGILAFKGLVLDALKQKPASLTSGLVEQQNLFSKLRYG